MGWPIPPELVASAEGHVAVASGRHPLFAKALAEHLDHKIFDDDAWVEPAINAIKGWADATWPDADVVIEFVGDRTFRLAGVDGHLATRLPSAYRWVEGECALRVSDEGAQALAQARAAECVILYLGTGRLPDGWTPPSGVPGFIVRPLAPHEVRIVKAQTGSEPTRPTSPEWKCAEADIERWRAWRTWKLRQHSMLIGYGCEGVIDGGEQFTLDEYTTRLHVAGQVDLADWLWNEAAQHIYRLTWLPAALGKGSGEPSGSAPKAPGAAPRTAARPATGPASGA